MNIKINKIPTFLLFLPLLANNVILSAPHDKRSASQKALIPVAVSTDSATVSPALAPVDPEAQQTQKQKGYEKTHIVTRGIQTLKTAPFGSVPGYRQDMIDHYKKNLTADNMAAMVAVLMERAGADISTEFAQVLAKRGGQASPEDRQLALVAKANAEYKRPAIFSPKFVGLLLALPYCINVIQTLQRGTTFLDPPNPFLESIIGGIANTVVGLVVLTAISDTKDFAIGMIESLAAKRAVKKIKNK